jgi:hypothetical protein
MIDVGGLVKLIQGVHLKKIVKPAPKLLILGVLLLHLFVILT